MDAPARQEPRDTLSREELQSVIGGLLSEAKTYDESDLAPYRAKATEYYLGKPFGNEQEGRSQVVTTEVREVVRGILPSLLRVCYGPDGAVEFVAPRPELELQSRKLTKYVKHIVSQDNPGFLEFHSWFKDAGVRRIGYLKWWWEATDRFHTRVIHGAEPEALALLAQDPTISYKVIEVDNTLGDRPTATVEVTKVNPDGRLRFQAVPPEEIRISPSARSLEDAPLVAHTRDLRVSDVVSMGYTLDEVLPYAGSSSSTDSDADVIARNNDRVTESAADDAIDDSTRPVVFTEAYVLLDRDGLGIAKRYLVHLLGETGHLVGEPEEVSHVPVAAIGFDPEPHTLIGLGLADDTMDLQLINSNVLRGILDSLGNTLDPATAIVEGRVNMRDVLNPERGKVIRMDAPGMVQELYHEFVGKEAFPLLDHLNRIKENRTGQSDAARGLDADALQSSAKQAVAATLSKAQERLELIARLAAETGLKAFYRGILQTLKEHQTFDRSVRLPGGDWITVGPMDWVEDYDIAVITGLGVGNKDEKRMALTLVAAKQEQALATGGMIGNPLVPLGHYRNTLARLAELDGLNPDEFYGRIDDQQLMAQQAAKPPEPSPEMVIAQAQAMKAQAEIQVKQQELMLKQAELRLKEQELVLEDAFQRDKLAQEALLERHRLEGEFNIEVSKAEVEAAVKREKNHLDAKPPTLKKSVKVERGPDGKISHMVATELPVSHSSEGE